MRSAWLFAALIVAGCAHERLAARPPAGVDLSGHWRLNAAESDDPQRLVGLLAGAGEDSERAHGGDEGGRGGGGDDGDGDGGNSRPASRGPAIDARTAGASIGAIAEAMRWPGKDLVIKQVGGVVAFSSDGRSRVYQPTGSSLAQGNEGRGRRASAPCGWSGDALLIGATPDDDGPPLEIRYQVSADHARLVQRIGRAGAAGGIEMIRVWDRVR